VAKAMTAGSALSAGELVDLTSSGEVLLAGSGKLITTETVPNYYQAKESTEPRVTLSESSAIKPLKEGWWVNRVGSTFRVFNMKGEFFDTTVYTNNTTYDSIAVLSDTTVFVACGCPSTGSLNVAKIVIDTDARSMTVTTAQLSVSGITTNYMIINTDCIKNGNGLVMVSCIYNGNDNDRYLLFDGNKLTYISNFTYTTGFTNSHVCVLSDSNAFILRQDSSGSSTYKMFYATISSTGITAVDKGNLTIVGTSSHTTSMIRTSATSVLVTMQSAQSNTQTYCRTIKGVDGTPSVTSFQNNNEHGYIFNISETRKTVGCGIDTANAFKFLTLGSLDSTNTTLSFVGKTNYFPMGTSDGQGLNTDRTAYMVNDLIVNHGRSQYLMQQNSNATPSCLVTHYNRIQAGMPAILSGYPMPYGSKRLPSTNLYVGGYYNQELSGRVYLYVGGMKQRADVTAIAAVGDYAEYKVAPYDSGTGLIMYTTDGVTAKLRAFTATSSAITVGTEQAVDTINDRRFFNTVDNMLFYERSPGAVDGIYCRPFTVAGTTATVGAELLLGTGLRVYMGRHGHKLVKADAMNNLLLAINHSDKYVKCIKTNATTTNVYDVSTTASVKVSGCKLDTDKFAVASSTTGMVLSLQLSDGAANLGSPLSISNAVVQAVLPVSATQFIIAYTNRTTADRFGYGKVYISGTGGNIYRSVTTDGDIGGLTRFLYASTGTTALKGKAWVSDDIVWHSPANSTYLQATAPSYFSAHPACPTLIVQESQIASGSGDDTAYKALTCLLPNHTFTTTLQVVNVAGNVMTLGDVYTLSDIQVADGGLVSPGTYWFQDTYGNYVEGSLAEISRSSIGVAKGDYAYGTSAKLALFGAKIDGSYANLDVGQSIVDGGGVEIGYAVSPTEVLMTEADAAAGGGSTFQAGSGTAVELTGSGTWTCTDSGVYRLIGVGGGGNGVYYNGTQNCTGGNGGNAIMLETYIPSGGIVSYAAAAANAPQTAGSVSALDGANTTITFNGKTYTAKGGKGGHYNTGHTSYGLTNSSNDTEALNILGGSGSSRNISNTWWSLGGVPPLITCPTATSTGSGNGVAGTRGGGGGSGSSQGGAGGAGLVIIERVG
jgi:hypothetical protein